LTVDRLDELAINLMN